MDTAKGRTNFPPVRQRALEDCQKKTPCKLLPYSFRQARNQALRAILPAAKEDDGADVQAEQLPPAQEPASAKDAQAVPPPPAQDQSLL